MVAVLLLIALQFVSLRLLALLRLPTTYTQLQQKQRRMGLRTVVAP